MQLALSFAAFVISTFSAYENVHKMGNGRRLLKFFYRTYGFFYFSTSVRYINRLYYLKGLKKLEEKIKSLDCFFTRLFLVSFVSLEVGLIIFCLL